MSRRGLLAWAAGLVTVVGALTVPVYAGVQTYSKGESWFAMGILVQAQYRNNNPDGGQSTDELFFRRLRPTLEGGLNDDWQGILQLDFGAGQSGEEYEITVIAETKNEGMKVRFNMTVDSQAPHAIQGIRVEPEQ